MIDRPYFMENKSWYELTEEGYILTEAGNKIEKVKKSYEQFLKDLKESM